MEVEYHKLVVKHDIKKLDGKNKERIKLAIEAKLIKDPLTFGKPLRRSLKGYRKFRVGDYRVIFKIRRNTVYILIIEHRSRVYQEIEKRIL